MRQQWCEWAIWIASLLQLLWGGHWFQLPSSLVREVQEIWNRYLTLRWSLSKGLYSKGLFCQLSIITRLLLTEVIANKVNGSLDVCPNNKLPAWFVQCIETPTLWCHNIIYFVNINVSWSKCNYCHLWFSQNIQSFNLLNSAPSSIELWAKPTNSKLVLGGAGPTLDWCHQINQ
jgi:hypothetical protein